MVNCFNELLLGKSMEKEKGCVLVRWVAKLARK